MQRKIGVTQSIQSKQNQRRRAIGLILISFTLLIPMVSLGIGHLPQSFWPSEYFAVIAIDLGLLIVGLALIALVGSGGRVIQLIMGFLFLPAAFLVGLQVQIAGGDPLFCIILCTVFVTLSLLHPYSRILVAVVIAVWILVAFQPHSQLITVAAFVGAMVLVMVATSALTTKSVGDSHSEPKSHFALIAAIMVPAYAYLLWYSFVGIGQTTAATMTSQLQVNLPYLYDTYFLSLATLARDSLGAVWQALLGSIGTNQDTKERFGVFFSTSMAIAFTAFWFWPHLMQVLAPYYRAGSGEEIGFSTLRTVTLRWGVMRGYAVARIAMPVFATAYIFLLLCTDYALGLEHSDYLGLLWLLLLLVIFLSDRSMLKVLPISVAMAVIGYFFGGTYFGAYTGALLPLAIVFSLHFKDDFEFVFYRAKVESQTGRRLDGEQIPHIQRGIARLGPLFAWGRWLITLLFVVITLLTFAELFDYWLPDTSILFLSAIGLNSSTLGIFVLLIVFLNISWRVFDGLADYVQLDLFSEIGTLLAMKKYRADVFDSLDSKAGGMKDELGGVDSDRIIDLRGASLRRTMAVLYYSSFDVVLTSIALFGIDFLPGLTNGEVDVLAFGFKVPTLLVFLARSLVMAIEIGKGTSRNSPYFRDIEMLLRKIQWQQSTTGARYVNLAGNRFLLGLSSILDQGGDSQNDPKYFS